MLKFNIMIKTYTYTKKQGTIYIFTPNTLDFQFDT